MAVGQLGLGRGHLGLLGGAGKPYDPVVALGSDLLAYWDAKRSDLITQSGGLVSSFKDSTSHAYNLTAATTARPTYGAAAFGGVDPSLTFDGTANVLSLGSQPFPSGAAGCEIWVVMEQDALVADATVRLAAAYGGAASSTRRGVGRTVSTLNRAILDGSDGTTAQNRTGSLIDFSTRHVIRAIFPSGDLWVDGIHEGTASVSTSNTGTVQFRIGANANTVASNFLQGQVALVAVTNPLGSCYTDARTAAFHNFGMGRRKVTGSTNLISAVGVAPDTIALGWPAFGSGTTSYKVFRNGEFVNNVLTPADLSFQDSGLSASTTYTYRIAAITPSGTVWSIDTTATTLAATPLLFKHTFEEAATTGDAKFVFFDKTLTTGQIVASTAWSRLGSKSVKFNLQYADLATNHHCQISHDYNAILGTDIWYSWSWLLDSSYLSADLFNDEILMQIHGATTGPAAGGPPPLAIYLSGSTLGFYTHGDPSTVYTPGNGPPRVLLGSAWTTASEVAETNGVDYVMRVNFNYSGGLVQVWRRARSTGVWVKIIDWTGSNIYHETTQTTELGPFFDVGPYKYNTYSQPSDFAQRIMSADEFYIGAPTAVFNDMAIAA